MSETEQPVWEFVANLGDVDVAHHGGFLVYRDTTGVYPPEVELYQADDDETGGTKYRFQLEPPRFNTCSHGPSDPCPGYPSKCPNPVLYDEWWLKDVPAVAEQCGGNAAELLADLESDDVVRRASAYRDLVAYHGADEFDSYPVRLTEVEAEERYKNYRG